MPKIALSMIVKNESNIIIDALENFRKHIDIDFFCICDTGSTDNTFELIESYLKENSLNGLVWREQFIDFSYNRNLTLEKCRSIYSCDYFLNMDADDRFTDESPKIDSLKLDKKAYSFPSFSHKNLVDKIALFKNDKNIFFKGVVHEFVYLPNNDNYKAINVTDINIIIGHFGNRNNNRTETELKDIEVLKKALLVEEDIRLQFRYIYYCGRGYYNIGNYNESLFFLKSYIHRTNDLGITYTKYINPLDEVKCYFMISAIFTIIFDFKQASSFCEKAIELFPINHEFKFLLARIKYRDKNISEAYDLILKYIDIDFMKIKEINIDFIYASYFDFIYICIDKNNYALAYRFLIVLMNQESLGREIDSQLVKLIKIFSEKKLIQNEDENLISLFLNSRKNRLLAKVKNDQNNL